MSQPLVSIIIPVFNREAIISNTLDSVKNQTYENWECIIVDDNSSDNSIKICEQYANENNQFKILKNTKPKGNASQCRNIGINQSEGEFIIFLDSDDYLLKTCLENRVKVIQRNPNLDFWVFPTFVRRPDSEELNKFNPTSKTKDHLKRFIRHNPPWTIMGPIWRKKSIQSIGGFDETFFRFQDPEIHSKALLNGLKYIFMKGKANADNVYVVDKKIEERPRYFKILVLNSCIHFINTIQPLALKKNRDDLNSDFHKLFTTIFKKFYFYTDIDESEVQLDSLDLKKICSKKDLEILNIQFYFKKKNILKWKFFRLISFKLWQV